jgi:hypothetical protein
MLLTTKCVPLTNGYVPQLDTYTTRNTDPLFISASRARILCPAFNHTQRHYGIDEDQLQFRNITMACWRRFTLRTWLAEC